MRTHRVGDRWLLLKPEMQQQWNLTAEDVEGVRGNLERLVDVLQARHGYSRLHAEREIARWRRDLMDGRALPRA
jgi:hypothetical protein